VVNYQVFLFILAPSNSAVELRIPEGEAACGLIGETHACQRHRCFLT